MESGIAGNQQQPFSSRLRLAGTLLISGLLVEIFSLMWQRPLAFMAFIFIGCTLLAAGAALFLWSILVLEPRRRA